MLMAAPRQQIVFHTSTGEVIQDLVRLDLFPVVQSPRLFHIRGVEIAHSERCDFSRPLEFREGVERLRKWNGSAPVQQVEIDRIDAKTAEAPVARRDVS